MNLSREDGGRNAIQWTPSNPATHGTSKIGLIIGVATFQGFGHIFSHTCRFSCLTLETTNKKCNNKIQSQYESQEVVNSA